MDGVMSKLVRYTRKTETLSEEIVGKSINTMFNGLSLLNFPMRFKSKSCQETSQFHGGISSLPTSIAPMPDPGKKKPPQV